MVASSITSSIGDVILVVLHGDFGARPGVRQYGISRKLALIAEQLELPSVNIDQPHLAVSDKEL
jgi:hypothetical protein